MLAGVLWGLAALAVLQVIWTVRNRRLLKLCNQIPGPGWFPIIGNFFSILACNFGECASGMAPAQPRPTHGPPAPGCA